jgi:hypothetical protein
MSSSGTSDDNPNLSNVSRSNLSGWAGSLEGTIFPVIGILADLSGLRGSQNSVNPANSCAFGVICPPLNVSTHIYEAMFGPRFSASLGKVRPFAEFEAGVGHINNGFTSDTAFATAVGARLRLPHPSPDRRATPGRLRFHHFFSTYQNNLR